MLESIKKIINDYILELDKGIVIESEVMYGENKLEYALSTDEYMASVSILSDYTYDFYAVEIESERTFMVKTKQFVSFDELITELKKDISGFSD
ncbi:hypothetical protein FE784_24375 [Paenibacillus hemerocallicola]|uniref:DUF1797 family protein n=2 Tax=Paenibacillus hemerocallicola TaxID=1172614 RepID=A0A5C4T3G8_9BACL|nr:hypothetical protein FE784_24375 [Paenibacillus hemerocallicola]